MTTSTTAFEQRIARLKADLGEQGRRVLSMVEEVVDAAFARDSAAARRVIENDRLIDKVDVEIERTAVQLLTEVARETADMDAESLRLVLTIVKVNNEVERIADGAVNVAESVESLQALSTEFPVTFRVMANSVIGILQTTLKAFDALDTAQARLVLVSDDTVDQFERELLRDAQRRLAEGSVSVDFAFALHTMATELERIGDHCTNIAEQVIYVTTGNIVRHTEGHWTDPTPPT